MVYLAAFANGMIGTAIPAVIAFLLVRGLARSGLAPFGAACVGVGYALGRFSWVGSMEEPADTLAMCRSAGALTAVFILVTLARRASSRQAGTRETIANAEALVTTAGERQEPAPTARMTGEVS